MKLERILSEVEKKHLQIVLNDPVALEAIRKVLLMDVYYSGTLYPGEEANPEYNFALMMSAGRDKAYSNEELGADLRAASTAIQLLINGFSNLSKFKEAEDGEVVEENQAR